LPAALYQRMTRVVAFVFIGSAMAIVALTGTPNATATVVLLAFGLILIELFQDVLPWTALGRLRLPIEAAVVLTLLTVLIAMTGGESSPYFFGYILVVGGAALSTSEIAAALLAVLSSGAYLTAVLVAAAGVPLESSAIGVVAFNLVAIALVMYVAAVIGREQRRAREAALELSRFDPLTGLLTRDYFDLALEQEILRSTRSGRPFGVIVADLDALRAANEQFGHDAGDELIKGAANAIRTSLRATDVAARNSAAADEYLVLLPETDAAGADYVAENIRLEISRVEVLREAGVVKSPASIGVASFPGDGRTSKDLIARADLAMFKAKRQLGGNTVVHYTRPEDPVAGGTGQTHRELNRSAPRSEQAEPRVDSGRQTDRVAAPASEPRTPVAVGPAPSQPRPPIVPEASRGPAPWETR
jgi:diguanylate cyclase (GGDEF)-like protein